MLGPLRRTAIRLWILLSLITLIFTDVTLEEVFSMGLVSIFLVFAGLMCAVLAFFIEKRSPAEFKYFGQPVAGGVAELRDEKFPGAWANVVIPVPYPLDVREGLSIDRIIPDDLKEQWAYFCKQPDYAEAFRTIIAYLASNPQTPAATVRGGHRGATLLEHSFNVWRTMRKEIDAFEYRGMKDRTGKIYFAMIAGESGKPYTFERDDPLPYLAAVTHDIGKIACYQPAGEGRWSEVLPEHDSEGAKILRRLRIYEKMPRDEAQRLIVTVGHYHKMESVPIVKWIDDRCRALLTILFEVDVKTGELEGDGAYDAFIGDVIVSKQAHQNNTVSSDLAEPEPETPQQAAPANSDVLLALTGQTETTVNSSTQMFAPLDDDDVWREKPGAADAKVHATPPVDQGEIDPLDLPFAVDAKPTNQKAKADNLDFGGAMDMLASKLDITTVIEACKKIETLMERGWGASGKGLHEKLSSIESQLPEHVIKGLRFVASVRNKCVHEATYTLTPDTLNSYQRTSENIIVFLSKQGQGQTSAAGVVADSPAKPKSKPVANQLDNTLTDDEIIALVAETLMFGNSINGKKNERVAYKHRSWLFIYEMDLCRAVDKYVTTAQKEHYGIRQETLYPADSGKHADFTRRLMVALANKGALRQEWNGNYYGDRSSYFWAMPASKSKTTDADQEAQQRTQHVIVCRAYAFGSTIFGLKSCQFEPIIQGCIYQPLSDDSSIERVKQRMAAWTEPKLLDDIKEEKKMGAEKTRSDRIHKNEDISKAPFEPSLMGSVSPEISALIFKQDPDHGALFAVDQVLKHFDEPMIPPREVEIDGVRYYSFSKKGK